jgi:hypothetical protein
MELMDNLYTVEQAKVMKALHERKLKCAEEWEKEQLQIFEEVIAIEEASLKEETARVVAEHYDNSLAVIISRFDRLMSAFHKDVEAYIAANPAREKIFRELVEKSKQRPSNKKAAPKQKPPTTESEEDVSKLLDTMKDRGELSNSDSVLAPKAFIYMGTLYSEGSQVAFKTISGDTLNAVISHVTETEVTFRFRDNGELPISARDFISKKLKMTIC